VSLSTAAITGYPGGFMLGIRWSCPTQGHAQDVVSGASEENVIHVCSLWKDTDYKMYFIPLPRMSLWYFQCFEWETYSSTKSHILTVYMLAIFAKTPQVLNILLHVRNTKSFGILPEVHGRYGEKWGSLWNGYELNAKRTVQTFLYNCKSNWMALASLQCNWTFGSVPP